MFKRHGLGVGIVALCLGTGQAWAVTDVVDVWNQAFQDTIRQTGGPPTPISRSSALMFVAMFDAMNAVNGQYTPYNYTVPAASGTSADAAAAVAAHDVLAALYPTQAAVLNTTLTQSLSMIPDGTAKTQGVTLGQNVAAAMLQRRSNDGANVMMAYTYGAHPGDYVPTPPDFKPMPATPDWGLVTPWVMNASNEFRPAGPAGFTDMAALMASPQYAAAFNQVKELGDLNSATRTADQTLLAKFWANDRDGTYKPPGQLDYITGLIAQQSGLSEYEKARLLALVNLAMADAGIAAWDCKFDSDIDLWRPVTGIRAADLDGNALTIADPTWEPLSDLFNGFTPPFPAYISGHATFAGAWAAVMADFFHSDQMTFTITSDDTPGVFRTFNSFSAAAEEDAQSRIYLGVHWQFDATDGLPTGEAVGHRVTQTALAPLPEPLTATLSGAALAALSLLLARRRPRR